VKWKFLLFSILFLGASLPLLAQDDAFVKEQIRKGYEYYEEGEYYLSLLSFADALEHEPGNIEASMGKLTIYAEWGRKMQAEGVIKDIWYDVVGDKEYMLPILRAQAVMYINIHDYDSALYWLDILEQQDSERLYAEEISEYRRRIRDEKLVLDNIVAKHDYSFLVEKKLSYPKLSLLIKTLLPSKCYEMPFFYESTAKRFTRSLSVVERWEVLEDQLVVIEGYAHREGTVRALFLFDMKERQGAVLNWVIGNGLYVFHKDEDFLNTDMRKQVVNDWIARIDKMYTALDFSPPTIKYIFEFSE